MRPRNFTVARLLLPQEQEYSSQMVPVGGLVYYISPPTSLTEVSFILQRLKADPGAGTRALLPPHALFIVDPEPFLT